MNLKNCRALITRDSSNKIWFRMYDYVAVADKFEADYLSDEEHKEWIMDFRKFVNLKCLYSIVRYNNESSCNSQKNQR